MVVVGEEVDPDPEGAGTRRVRLVDPSVVTRSGTMPLPPYIARDLADPERYQTVYSADRGLADRSAAAPTAGLHFTPDLLAACEAAGARLARVDLAIGLDTFRPGDDGDRRGARDPHRALLGAGGDGGGLRVAGRVIAVGTTAVRALESAAATGALSGRTDLYIHGSFRFRVVDVLVTNFHLPRSSLLLLVEAFCGPVWRSLYATALADGYRFLSFGDAMVVGRAGPKGRARLGRRRRGRPVNPLVVEVEATDGAARTRTGGHATRLVPDARVHAGRDPGRGQGARRRRPRARWAPRWCWPTPTT